MSEARITNWCLAVADNVPAVLTDAEVVDFFLRVDWKLRCDQPQPVGRDW